MRFSIFFIEFSKICSFLLIFVVPHFSTLEGIAGLDPANPEQILSAKGAPEETLRVLAGAHALHMSDDRQLVGDPLEIAIMNEIEWTLKGDHVSPMVKGKMNRNFKIEKKFHFSSARARMSTLISHDTATGGAKYTAVIKGGVWNNLPTNFGKKSKFWQKNILSKNRNFGQDSISWSKIEILVKNRNFYQK